MAADTRRGDALQLIFSFFLAILLVVLIGVGVWTFYPDPYGPTSAEQVKIERLNQEQNQIMNSTTGKQLTPAQQAKVDDINKEIETINKSMQKGRDAWAVNTSVVLLIFATVLMAVSLFLPEHLRVFSNGVLLGGLFTVIYGTGWSFAGGNSRARFFVVLVAVTLTVAFGYLRFIRGKRAAVAPVASAAGASVAPGDEVDASALAALAARVDAIEERAEAAAAALSAGRHGDRA